MSTSNIFQKPTYIVGFDDEHPIPIYPITMEDYDKFQSISGILYISKKHFQDSEIPLLALIFICRENLNYTEEQLIDVFCILFSLITKMNVSFISNEEIEGFVLEDGNVIDVNNYELIREIIMKQNLLFEQKVYKDPRVQEWATLTLQAKMKNQPKIGIEEMLTTVSTFTGKHYWDLQKYSIYQIYSDFYRIRKTKSYDSAIMARCQGAEIDIEDFAEYLDLYKNPYDDLFVSNDKLNKFEK